MCIREVQKSIRDSVYRLICDKIEQQGASQYFEITDTEIRGFNGSLFIFRGMKDQNADAIKSLEGFDVAWCEEAQTMSERSLDLLLPTIRKPGSEVWFSYNPRYETDPVDVTFRQTARGDTLLIRVGYEDNPWFPDELRAQIEHDRLTSPEKAAHVWDGEYEALKVGAYYAHQIVELERDGQITEVPHDPSLAVHTAWDLGVGDSTAIWFYQQNGVVPRIIDFYEADGQGAPHYAEMLQSGHRAKYRYGKHYFPHDVGSREWGTGRSRIEVLRGLGIEPTHVPKLSVDDGINAVRVMLPMCLFDAKRCKPGLQALKAYRADWDENRRILKPVAVHDWSSHASDALRYMAVSRPNHDGPIARTKDYGFKSKAQREAQSWDAW